MDFLKLKRVFKENNLDAYIIYDFRGSDYLGRSILGFAGQTTRRFVSLLTRAKVVSIVSQMEKAAYKKLPGEILYYTSYQDYEKLIGANIKNLKKVALNISDTNSLPILDLAPYGFVQLLKKLNPKMQIVSSDNITQGLAASWGKKGYNSHKKAVEKIKNIFDKTFKYIKSNVFLSKGISDHQIMSLVTDLQQKLGLTTDGENICIVASDIDTANPHYWPKKDDPHPIFQNSPLLIDIWARTEESASIYADFTLYAWVGPNRPLKEITETWEVWKGARDLGIEFLQKNIKKGIKGFEVDRKIRSYFGEKGYSEHLLHRSGHSLGQKEHGNGANLDDFETHDTRQIITDTGLTIEPGIYTKNYGVRGEIDIYIHPDKKIEVTTPLQEEIILI